MFLRCFIKTGLCAGWLLAIIAGIAMLLNYQTTEGSAGAAPAKWPVNAGVSLDAQRQTLLMFAHPQCPCTQASLEELNRLLAKSNGQIAAQIFFIQPGGVGEEWTFTAMRTAAAAIPGVTVRTDFDGKLAKRFGAETSGQVLIYNSQGRLLFQGGITSERGHMGDNAGENAVTELASTGRSNLKETPVFGCSLLPAAGADK